MTVRKGEKSKVRRSCELIDGISVIPVCVSCVRVFDAIKRGSRLTIYVSSRRLHQKMTPDSRHSPSWLVECHEPPWGYDLR